MKRLILSVITAGLMFSAQAQVPGTLSYQGILVDGTGAPLTDGTHNVKFILYDAVTAGVVLHQTQTFTVTTFKGMFSTIIGNSVPSGAANPPIPLNLWDAQVWAEVVADGTTLAPRIQLTATPYAFKAEAANTVVNNAITSTKILDGAIAAADLGTDAVTSVKILDGTIAAGDLGTDAVTSVKILDGTIAVTDMGADAVTSAKILDGTIAAADLGTGAVTSVKILDGTIAAADLAAGSVSGGNAGIITDGTITAADLASGSVDNTKLATGIDASKVTVGVLPASVIPSSVASGSGASGQVAFFNGANTITSGSGLQWNNGLNSLGIGGAPAFPFTVISTTASSINPTALVQTTGATSSAALRFTNATPQSYNIGITGTGEFGISSLNNNLTVSDFLRLGTTGNMGIGTSTPQSKLDVEGGVTIGANYSGTSAAPANGLLVEGAIGVGTTAPNTGLIHLAGTASVYNGIHFTQTASGSTASDGFLLGPSTFNTNDLYLWNYEPAGTLTLGTAGTGRLTVAANGNIGLGTAPVSKLDVEGGAVIGATFAGSNAAPSNGLLLEGQLFGGITSTSNTWLRAAFYQPAAGSGSSLMLYTADTGNAGSDGAQISLTPGTNPALEFRNREAGDITFLPNNIEKMRLTSTGLLGIGTATPAYPFHIETPSTGITAYIDNNTLSSGYGLYATVNATATAAGTRYGVYSTVSGGQSTQYGLRGNASGGGTTNYGVYGSASGGTVNDYAVYASGDIAYTGTITDVSDRRLKKDIQIMSSMMPGIMQLKPSTFKYKTDEYKFMNLPKTNQLGLIAQEVEPLFPEAVTNNVHPGETDENGKTLAEPFEYKGIDYTTFIPVLIKGVQEQQIQIEDLKSTIKNLEAKLNQYEGLSAEINELRKLLSQRGAPAENGKSVTGGNKK